MATPEELYLAVTRATITRFTAHCHGVRKLAVTLPVGWGLEKIRYIRYRFPPEVIHQAGWLQVRFTRSFRDGLVTVSI